MRKVKPILLIIIIIIAIIGLYIWSKSAQDKAMKARINRDLGNITLSDEKIKEVAESAFDTYATEQDRLEQMEEELDDIKKAFGMIKWKVEFGEESSETDLETYRTIVNGYAQMAVEWIKQKHYVATLAIKGLFKNGGGEETLESINKAYQADKNEITENRNSIEKEWEEVAKDGKITLDEWNKIDEKLKRITEIKTKHDEAQKKVEESTK